MGRGLPSSQRGLGFGNPTAKSIGEGRCHLTSRCRKVFVLVRPEVRGPKCLLQIDIALCQKRTDTFSDTHLSGAGGSFAKTPMLGSNFCKSRFVGKPWIWPFMLWVNLREFSRQAPNGPTTCACEDRLGRVLNSVVPLGSACLRFGGIEKGHTRSKLCVLMPGIANGLMSVDD